MGEQLSMSVFAIVQEYKLAKNKTQQIKILADENLCEQRQIAQILFDNGQRLPVNWYNKITTTKPRHRKDDPAQEPTMEPAGDSEPAPEPEGREELKALFEQVARLAETVQNIGTELITVERKIEEPKPRITAADIKSAFFDILVDELQSDDETAAKRATILVAIETVRQLLERLEAQP